MFSLLLAGTAIFAAQDPAALQRRLKELETLRQRAVIAAARSDSAQRERVDTIRAGALFILTAPRNAERVRPGAQTAWSQLDSLYGDEAASLASQPMLFGFSDQSERTLPHHFTNVQQVLAASSSTRGDIARQLAAGAATLLRQHADTALTNWFGPLLLPRVQGPAEAARIYVDLVTSPSAAVRHCYEGDAAGCRAALGLVDGGDRVTLWFDATERRAFVNRLSTMDRAGRKAEADACLLAQSDEGCIAVLHSLTYIEAPLSVEARHSFARAVLTTGGRGAYARLLQSAGHPLSQRFAAAAGLSPDSTVLRWRSAILAGRPRTVTLARASGWMALGWVLVFGLLALRSTRWR